jgi:hypothetical protein
MFYEPPMESPNACIPNIGPRERRKRVTGGIVMLLIALALAAFLLHTGVTRAWRALVFIPLWMSATGFFQARYQTCVALTARGTQNMDAGEQPVSDPSTLVRMRAQAMTVHVQSVVTAALIAALIVLLPL